MRLANKGKTLIPVVTVVGLDELGRSVPNREETSYLIPKCTIQHLRTLAQSVVGESKGGRA